MDIITAIKYFLVIIIGIYIFGLAVVWICEILRNNLHRQMQTQIKFLESLKLSMAVLHAKTYGIIENYRRNSSEIEKIERFVLVNVLFIVKRNDQSIASVGVI